jgi:hypothetical protein
MRNFQKKRPRLKLASAEYHALRNQALRYVEKSARPPREITQHAWNDQAHNLITLCAKCHEQLHHRVQCIHNDWPKKVF